MLAGLQQGSEMQDRFDKAYYDRYYRNPRTRAVTPAAASRQAAFIAAYLKHLGIGVKHVLDVGCGTGTLLRALGKALPRARLRGAEFSEYLCRRYGWQPCSIAHRNLELEPADLVVCNDVLGYLNDADCRQAIANLSRLSRKALYFGVLTREDLPLCDRSRTDPAQLARPLAWYRKRLSRDFLPVGGGLFLKKPLDVTVWHLERG